MKKRFYLFLCLCSLAMLATSCDTNRVFEENQDIANNQWPVKLAPAFEFEITDTTQQYNVYFNVRNALHYPFYNLYLRHALYGPDGKQISTKLHEMYLMDPKTGEPRGKGAGDIFDHQFKALKNTRFPKAGKYRLTVKQYMRQDPLPGVMAVGIRVEKAVE